MASYKKVSNLTTLQITGRWLNDFIKPSKDWTKNIGIVLRIPQTRFKQAVNFKFLSNSLKFCMMKIYYKAPTWSGELFAS